MPRYDMHLQPLAPEVQRAIQRPVGFGYKPAIAVSGYQALMDQWMRLFLTPKGSDPCAIESGTDAWALVGSTATPEHALEVLTDCVRDCNEQIIRLQAKQLRKPIDELLEDAKIVRSVVDVTGPGIEVWIRLTNRAGTSRVVLLPSLAAQNR